MAMSAAPDACTVRSPIGDETTTSYSLAARLLVVVGWSDISVFM
jgi:hypothetical protein